MKLSKAFICLLSVITGAVIGSLIAQSVAGIEWLHWLSFGVDFGISSDDPFVLNLILLKLSFGITFNVNLASLLGIIGALLFYRKLG